MPTRCRLDNSWSGGQASQQIADADGDQCRGDRLVLDHVAEARDLLLRLASGLVVQALRLCLGVAGELARLLLHPTAHLAGGTLEIAHAMEREKKSPSWLLYGRQIYG